MANIIKSAINYIRNSAIPNEILEEAFLRNSRTGFNNYVNLETEIEEKIFRLRILPDCNTYGGTQVIINVNDIPVLSQSNTEKIIKIPLEKTNGKKIISIYNACYFSYVNTFAGNAGISGLTNSSISNPIMTLTADLLASIDTVIKPSTAMCDLIMTDNNVIRLYNLPLASSAIYYIRANLEYDENLGEIKLSNYNSFYKLVEYATKAYIYNKLIVRIDKGQIQGGYEIGKMKDIVESYSDANENYNNYLENTWKKQLYMNDSLTYTRHLTSMFR